MVRSSSARFLVLLAVNLAVVVGLAACGPKGPWAGPLGPGASEFAGLRWVPPDVTYALVTRRSEDAILVLRDLADSLGLLDGEDAASIGAQIAEELGFDPLSATAIAEQGVDLTRGLAVWSRGFGPSIAIPLTDAPRFVAMIEERRSHGAVVQVDRVNGVELYSWRPEREVAVHWAIVDDWLLAHLELADEHEPERAWYEAALAAQGRFGAEADFTAARDEATARVGPPGVVAVVRMPALFASPMGAELRPCRDTLGKVGRVFIGAVTDGKDARGSIVVELPGGLDGIRAAQLPVPSGWVAARGAAPLQVELGLDLREVAPRWGGCLDVDDLGELATESGIYGGRAFAHDVDLGNLKGRGAVEAVGEARAFAELLDEIPAPDFLRKQRKVGAIAVVDLNVPMMPRLSYAFIGTTAIATVDVSIDPLLGAPAAPGDELGRLEVRPQAWSAEVWDQLIGTFMSRERTRERMVRGLRRWSLGSVIVHLDGRAVVIDLHGRH